jgi:choline kinase
MFAEEKDADLLLEEMHPIAEDLFFNSLYNKTNVNTLFFRKDSF